jgi:2-polyprenyl-6-methoxyphenol hydroxylase-like FAD-dependent oxidoreductase
MEGAADIAFVGGGPAALVAAIALARRGVRTTVFEREAHPEVAPRFNPDRSYTIDISGHGYRALRHIEACSYFDEKLIRFKGIKMMDQRTAEWTLPGWTGSRGDILCALMALIEEKHRDLVRFEFEHRVDAVDIRDGTLTHVSQSGSADTERFDLVIGADEAGSVVRDAMLEQVGGFTVEKKSFSNYCTMIELDLVGDRLDQHYLHGLSIRPFCVAGAIKGEDGPKRPGGSAPSARRRRWCSLLPSKRAGSSESAVRAFSNWRARSRSLRLRIAPATTSAGS